MVASGRSDPRLRHREATHGWGTLHGTDYSNPHELVAEVSEDFSPSHWLSLRVKVLHGRIRQKRPTVEAQGGDPRLGHREATHGWGTGRPTEAASTKHSLVPSCLRVIDAKSTRTAHALRRFRACHPNLKRKMGVPTRPGHPARR